MLNAEAAVEQTKGDVTITLVDAVQQGQKLIVNLMVSDYSEREKPDEKRYGEAIWITGEGIKVTGPGILEENSRPIESQYIPWSEFYEEYGYMRYFMAASFELSPDSNVEEYPAAYSCSILAVGEAVKEGILVDWYSYSESGRTASISFTPPGQIPDRPILSLQERDYPAERKLLYTKKLELYQPEGVVPAGYLYNQLFPVPEEERVGSCFLTVPGITYLQPDESEEITLSIPKESEELDVEIPFEEGTVRIEKIARMTAQEEDCGKINDMILTANKI